MAGLTQGLLTGLVLGGSYGLVAMGFSLFYKAARVINVAHGSVLMLAAFAVATLVSRGVPLGLALGLGLLVGAMLGGFLYVVVMRPAADRSPQIVILATLAAAFLAQGLAQRFAGTETQTIPAVRAGVVRLPGGVLTSQQLIGLGFVCVVALVAALVFGHTMLGRSLRAVADDAQGAMVVGIEPTRVLTGAAIAGGLLASCGAILVVPQTGVSFDSGLAFTLTALTAAILGGIDSIWGAFCGGLLLGIASGVVTTLAPEWFAVVQMAVMLAVLTVRPTGMLGGRA